MNQTQHMNKYYDLTNEEINIRVQLVLTKSLHVDSIINYDAELNVIVISTSGVKPVFEKILNFAGDMSWATTLSCHIPFDDLHSIYLSNKRVPRNLCECFLLNKEDK